MPVTPRFFFMGVITAGWMALMAPVQADIYKYQKDGVWHYTDSPSPHLSQDVEKIVENRPAPSEPENGGRPLLTHYPAQNALERAAAATVAVKSPLGYGSGFFITRNGFLITNRHVIRGSRRQTEKDAAFFDDMEKKIGIATNSFEKEEKQISNYQKRLEDLLSAAEKENNALEIKRRREVYKEEARKLAAWKADFQERKRRFSEQKSAFQSDRSDYEYRKTIADLSQSFTIVLADHTQHYARLVAVSDQHDLALLKLDGVQVPALKPAPLTSLLKGDPVYAIGNPAKLHNSLTSGVFSGHEQGYIQTNAQIYPGNSGGPLVNDLGAVIGVNTFKKITYKFEGLGFAIPIAAVFETFRAYLPDPLRP